METGVAVKASLVGKALKGLKAAVTERLAASEPSGASEKVVAIPEIAVFSELPFSQVGVIGGAGVNIVTNPSKTPRKAAKKAAPRKATAPSRAKRSTTKKSAVKKTNKRTKAR
jgi:hypothetical protein